MLAAETNAQSITSAETVADAKAKDVQAKLKAELYGIQARLKTIEDSGKQNPNYAEDVRKEVEIQNRLLAPRGLPTAGSEREEIIAAAKRNVAAGEEKIRQNNKLSNKGEHEQAEAKSESAAVGAQAAAKAGSGWQDNAKRAIQTVGNALQRNPGDYQLIEKMITLLEHAASSLDTFDQKEAAAYREMEGRLKRVEQKLMQQSSWMQQREH